MAKMPPSPELVQAYQLIKQGQQQQAGQLLKAYLNTHPKEADAWWLMAHAVSKPEHVRRSLEMVLKCDPGHERALKKLARLDSDAPPGPASAASGAASVPPPPPPPAPPAASRPVSRPGSRPAPASAAPSFEEYLAAEPAGDPLTAAPGSDPFAAMLASNAPIEASSTTTVAADDSLWSGMSGGATSPAADTSDEDSSSSYNFFATSNRFDPAAAAHLRSEPEVKQAAGTGAQPDWGPGLAFVAEGQPPQVAAKLDYAAQFVLDDDVEVARKPSYEAWLGWALAAVAVIVLLSLVAYFLLNRGEDVPEMTTLDGNTFTVSYPEGWNVQCGTDSLGYQVCGIANHAFYNELALYLGGDIDIGSMLSDALSMAFTGGDNLPRESVSIIVMDVSERSPAYDPASWAKTKYEWTQNGWSFIQYDEVIYNKQNNPPRQVNGREAYYYEFISRDNQWGRDIAYDVYIPHDGLMLWMTVSINGPERGKDYHAMVQEMIDSIQIKPAS